MLSKAKHKIRLTQNKSKTHKLCKNKNMKREKKVIESLGDQLHQTLWKALLAQAPHH